MFSAFKYKGIIVLSAVLILGLLLLCGKSNQGTEFNASIFSFRRITLAPIIIIASYIGFIWLILHQPSK